MYDLIIRGGTIVDGTGAAPYSGDIAVQDGRIAATGTISGPARQVIDADGATVTPGFVDIHTHYDGQVTWDPQLAPSLWHGVTTIVQGNCGVGFAPVRPGRQDELISQMEGVEDIPGTALHEGIVWDWESFPEYLDSLARKRWTMDVGTQVPHAALRSYVMGERSNDPNATPDDIGKMTEIVRESILAGALGFTTSRMLAHVTSVGGVVPGTFAAIEELEAIGRTMADLDTGVFGVVPRGMDGEVSAAAHAELEWMGDLARNIGRPVLFSLVQTHTEIDRWRLYLDRAAELRAGGVPLYPEVGNRPTGILIGLQSDQHLFSTRPGYRAIAHLPTAERARRMRDPEVRARILGESGEPWPHPGAALVFTGYDKLLPVRGTFNIEPTQAESIAAIAGAEGRTPEEVVYDLMAEGEGRNFFLFPFTNYMHYSLDDVHEMLTHPATVFGLGDGGAHCGLALDATSPTFMLSHWVRDRTRGPKVPIEQAVRWMTNDTAQVYGLLDRGRIAPGYKADINVIDLDALGVELPEMIFDLPAKGRRLMQRARGYDAIVQSGEITVRRDEATGALPGRLIRGAQPAPLAYA